MPQAILPHAAPRPRLLPLLAALALGGLIGWLAHPAAADAEAGRGTGAGAAKTAAATAIPATPSPASTAAPLPAAVPPGGLATWLRQQAPVIVVASDGTATLRVEQQPLAWVLEQIAAQSGWSDVHQRACAGGVPSPTAQRPASRPTDAAPAPPAAIPLLAMAESAAAQADPAAVLQALESGDERGRFQALMLARTAGLAVPEATLLHLQASGPSPRVQLAAFETHLAARAGDPPALRALLETARHAASAAVRQDATERLAALDRLQALPPLADP